MKTHPNPSLLLRMLFVFVCVVCALAVATPVMAQEPETTSATGTAVLPSGTAILPSGTAVLPEAYYNRTLEELAAEDTSALTIWEIINSIKGLEMLVLAVETAGFEAELMQPGPITFFAPTNGAFDDLPDGTLENLISDGREPLYSILEYHMLLGEQKAFELTRFGTALTVHGDRLSIEVTENGTITVDGAIVFQVDIEAANGVMYVIDTMLNPF